MQGKFNFLESENEHALKTHLFVKTGRQSRRTPVSWILEVQKENQKYCILQYCNWKCSKNAHHATLAAYLIK